ncbi:hypothetical protein [Phosphitispora sp. TUW77]|uniref:hypothetical protein n=1 Tax=Phosphitispora sp. TUW77 TaxID=3152361 RepID=UPI003AB2231F
MNSIPIDPNIGPLLQGFRPYFGAKGQVITDSLLSLLEVVSSNPGQEAVKTMSKALASFGSEEKIFTLKTATGTLSISLNLVFTLFLILILLILSGNLLAFSHDTYENEERPEESAGDNFCE